MCELCGFTRPLVSCCPEWSSLLVWTPASPSTDSWHTGTRHRGNTAMDRWWKLFCSDSFTDSLASSERKYIDIKMYSHFHRQILVGLSFVFLYSLHPAPQPDHMCCTHNRQHEDQNNAVVFFKAHINIVTVLKTSQQHLSQLLPTVRYPWPWIKNMWPHQFLQAFFFFPAPSPQLGALSEAGSGFFKSSSSNSASESTRSWTKTTGGTRNIW